MLKNLSRQLASSNPLITDIIFKKFIISLRLPSQRGIYLPPTVIRRKIYPEDGRLSGG